MSRHPYEARLRELQRLIDGMIGQREDEDAAQSHWELPVLPPPDPEGRLSSTDLLSWWFRAPKGGLRGWDEYFDPAGEEEPREARRSRPRLEPERGADPQLDPAFPWAKDAGLSISTLFPEPEEQLADEHAQAAVDCL